jgi:3-isopropylmalate dehydrogenase|tara:strand:- start:2377 stop:3501 length:1125 start_codon:yes stop_codon:yes gene_type:complete
MSDSTFLVATMPGDGIGKDIIKSATSIVDLSSEIVGGYKCNWQMIKAGAEYFALNGIDVEPGGEDKADKADSIFLGAIGLPTIRHKDGTEICPHLRFREIFGLYAGVRPVKAYPNITNRLSNNLASKIDLVILRESTEGLFYSAAVHNRCPVDNDNEVQDIMRITRKTTEKLHDFAFKLARQRKSKGKIGKVTCVDKANVFRSQAFFRKIFDERKVNFDDINSDHCYVDAMALNLIRNPWEYDILVMENMFGDILSDLGGGLVGGMGMASCAEIGDNHGLFQPAHGSAPDIMGQDKANPLATILSAALMLDYLSEKNKCPSAAKGAKLIETAIEVGFEQNKIRPMEFGGDMGTEAVSNELMLLLKDKLVQNKVL